MISSADSLAANSKAGAWGALACAVLGLLCLCVSIWEQPPMGACSASKPQAARAAQP